jgi:hypothetical protein
MWRSPAQWFWILVSAGIAVCQAASPIPVSVLSVKGVYATKVGDPTSYCLLGSGACAVPEDPGTADDFIAQWLGRHPRAVAIPISEEIRPSLMRGTVMPREVFIWVEDGEDSLSLSLVRRGFYPAAAFQDMVARDQAFRNIRERISAKAGSPTSALRFEVPAENRPRRLVSDAEYVDRADRAAAAEAGAKRSRLGIWSDRHPRGDYAKVAAQMSAQGFPAMDLYVSGIHAHRLGDPDIYCLLGGVTCALGLPVPSLVPGEMEFVQHWLASHPHAEAVPVSGMNYKRLLKGPILHSTYIWIEEGSESLNIELVRNGFYFSDALEDMVTYDKHFMAEMSAPQLATADDELRREREETGAPIRFVSDADYATYMARAVAAEHGAERRRKGLWSDAYLPLWRPPSDEQLIAKYRRHNASFSQIASLIGKNRRLLAVNWNPKSWAAARSAGVPRADIDVYVQLLRKLGVNQELTEVVGLGKFCLITSDITYGLLDNGVIKGYVFSPTDPQPLVSNLEHRGSASDATTTYRKIDGDWYLFELVH